MFGIKDFVENVKEIIDYYFNKKKEYDKKITAENNKMYANLIKDLNKISSQMENDILPNKSR